MHSGCSSLSSFGKVTIGRALSEHNAMATEWRVRDDAYLREARARVAAVDERGVVLDRTIFYPQGGGQMGDTGVLTRESGDEIRVVDTRKGDAPDSVLHLLADGARRPEIGETVGL